MSYIYMIQNVINNKVYVGITMREVGVRWNEHIQALNKNQHHNKHLQRAWNKYGSENFAFIILKEYEDISWDELCEIEKRTISLYDSFENGYNLTLGGDGVKIITKYIYRINKFGVSSNGKQLYCIDSKDRRSQLMTSVNKSKLEPVVELLNNNEEKYVYKDEKGKYRLNKENVNFSLALMEENKKLYDN